MKFLYLIRHAKSSWKDITLDDFDRPLNSRGKENAPFMAKKLKHLEEKPDLILASPSKRTKCTAEIFAKIFEYHKPIEYEEKIYESNLITLKNVIQNIPDKYQTVFLFGHNPSLNLFVEDFCKFYENVPTSGIVKIKFDCESWTQITPANSQLVDFLYPKKYL